MTALYNEIDPYAAQWTRNLIAAGHVAPGVVDERSIADLAPADVAGPGQRHFFAGIAVWSYALRLAGVPDDADVWTASCPCQPFSGAGRRRGTADERHLWPALFALVEKCRPPVLFGEQVASVDVIGRNSRTKTRGRSRVPAQVSTAESGEGSNSARKATRTGEVAAVRSGRSRDGDPDQNRYRSVRGHGAPVQPRRWQDMGQPVAGPDETGSRLYVQQHPDRLPCCEQRARGLGGDEAHGDRARDYGAPPLCLKCLVDQARREVDGTHGGAWLDVVRSDLESVGYAVGAAIIPAASVGAPHIRQRLYFVAYADGATGRLLLRPRESREEVAQAGGCGEVGDVAHAIGERWQDRVGSGSASRPTRRPSDLADPASIGWLEGFNEREAEPDDGVRSSDDRGPRGLADADIAYAVDCDESRGGRLLQPAQDAVACDPWSACDWIPCSDGKARPVEPGTFPLAHGIAGRVGQLRAYGNAIVAQQAAAFIRAALGAVTA